jgi:hypothetical protein
VAAARKLRPFAAGFSVTCVPYLALLATAGFAVIEGIFGYRPAAGCWGIHAILVLQRFGTCPAPVGEMVGSEIEFFHINGGLLVLGAALLINLLLRHSRYDVFVRSSCTYALFLVLASGFGLQYLFPLIILTSAHSLRWGVFFSVLSTLVIGHAYYNALRPLGFLHVHFPLIRDLNVWFALILFGGLILFVAAHLTRHRGREAEGAVRSGSA